MSDGARGAKRLLPALLVIIIALASFLFFGVFFRDEMPAIASEIAAAFLGALITVLITMMLLNRQSEAQEQLLAKQSEVQGELLNRQFEADRAREMGATFLAQKISTYDELMNEIRSVMVKGTIEPQDTVALQIINQKIALYASPDALKSFSRFTAEFGKVAVDGEIDEEERDSLLQLLADLSVKMRQDLGTGGELDPVEEIEIVASVQGNAKALSMKTTEEEFLANCEGEEVEYFRRVFEFLKSQNAQVVMGQKGFSIWSKGKSRIRCYPTNVKKSIEILNKYMHQPTAAKVRELLGPVVCARIQDDKTYITFKPAELPLERFLELIALLTK